MECRNNSGEYLSYNCYSTLKSYFDNSQLSYTGTKIFDETKKKLKEEYQNIDTNHKIFSDFARFLTKDHNFSTYGYPISCTYLNVWLNDEVKNRYSSEFESKFHVFRDFARKFATESKNHNYPRDSCEIYIKKPDDEYRKKEILYKLYYYYTEHKTPLNYTTGKPLCDNINLIVSESWNANEYIKNDEHFKKTLKDLKDIIIREEHHKNECDYSILKNMLPKEDPKPIVEAPVMPVHNSLETNQLTTPPNEGLEHRLGENRHNVEIGLSETEGLGQQPKLQEEEPPAAMTPSQTLQKQLSFRVSQEGVPLDKRTSQENPSFRTRHQEARLLKLERELTQTDDYLYGDTQHARSDERGVLGTIQNTFSDVLGSVEPAPILGVSGGMGVLFLLFKYTPVGTFFRGRRGRTYGIPSGFNGPFPGEFPGYQDYLGANIGYSQMNPHAE